MGELNLVVRELARGSPGVVAQRARPAEVDGVAEDAVGLDAAQYVLDLGAALEDALGLEAVLLGEGLLLGDVDDGHEGREAGLLAAR